MKHVFSYLLYRNYAILCFLQKLLVPPLKKLSCSIIQPLFEIKVLRPTRTDFTTPPAPSPTPFQKEGCTCHEVTKSAGPQTSDKSLDHDSMTTQFYNVY